MIKILVVGIVCFLFGLISLIVPQYLKYFESGTTFFKVGEFLNNHPECTRISGYIFVCLGLIHFSIWFVVRKKENEAFVIQNAIKRDYGEINLNFSRFNRLFNKQDLYTCQVSKDDYNTRLIAKEKKNIQEFYSSFKNKRKINFAGICAMPFLTYAGFTLGECGSKINYYHFNRERGKLYKIKGNERKNQLVEDERIEKGFNDWIFSISVSYPARKEEIIEQFKDKNILFLKSSSLGTDIKLSREDINYIAKQVREYISKATLNNNNVSLLLSCPSELCFEIGRKLNSPGLSHVFVYHYSASKKIKWSWCVELKNE